MDLRSLMNDGSAEEEATKKRKSSPEMQRVSHPSGPANGQPPTPGGHAPPLHQQQQFPPPSAGGARPYPGQQGLTPIQTAGSQYPYPAPPAQSPAGIQPQRSHDGFSATPPGGRPPSHGYPHAPQRSPSQHGAPGLPHGIHAHPNSSVSPTPSHHSQTSHSVRQSPLSIGTHPPHHPPPIAGHQYQYSQHSQPSQPSTPLGPPPLQYQRSAGAPQDWNSPYHQRTFSGASNGIASGSPAHPQSQSHAHYHGTGGSYAESPNAYNHQRRTSSYLEHVERERSVSVSPKTKVAPRPSSLSSRHSSQQDVYNSSSNRSSGQQSAAGPLAAASPSHVMQPPHYPHQPPPNGANEAVAQAAPSSIQSNQYANPPPAFVSQASSSSMSNEPTTRDRPPIHHHNQKLEMHHLVTPTSEVPPAMNGSLGEMASKRTQDSPSIFMKPSPKVKKSASPVVNTSVTDGSMQADTKTELSSSESKSSLKRAADDAPSSQPPPKQRRMLRKYPTRPAWAQLSKHNPRFSQQQQQSQRPNGAQSNGSQGQQRPQQSNGPASVDPNLPPWQQKPPLDMDLIKASSVLGKWEKTFRWNTPYPDMLAQLQDWLFVELSQLGDVGMDAREGTIEIEAKFGTLMQSGSDDRCALPIKTMAIIHPQANGKYHFESQMTTAEHQAMNTYLNESIQSSMQKGRVHMEYKHLYERDSFHALSPYGLSLLPASLQKRRGATGRDPRLRITTNTKTGEIVARIVKLPLAHLHLFNPNYKYDARVSINLEVNLMRADIRNPADLIQPSHENEPDRVKDRLSYKHLAYSIDLTKVERAGLNPIFELELEVDSVLLRRQMQKLSAGEESAFGDVVASFLDNATFLMRQRSGL